MARGGSPSKGPKRESWRAAAHKKRLEIALSGIGGFCRALDEIDTSRASTALSEEERQTWVRHARSYGRHLSQFARILSQEQSNAEAPQD